MKIDIKFEFIKSFYDIGLSVLESLSKIGLKSDIGEKSENLTLIKLNEDQAFETIVSNKYIRVYLFATRTGGHSLIYFKNQQLCCLF